MPIAGIPTTTWSDEADGAVLTNVTPVRIQVRYDRTFMSTDPEGSTPSLERLDVNGPPFLQDVVGGEGPDPGQTLPLRAGAHRTLQAIFDKNNAFHLET